MKTIGQTIKEIRINKNLTQEQIKSVKQSSLSAIESDKRIPSIEIFTNILKELNINVLEFLYIQNNFRLPRKNIYSNYLESKAIH